MGWLMAWLTGLAVAAPLDDVGGRDDELWKALENMPPDWSTELAVAASYSDITYWNAYTGPYPGFGLHWGLGKHLGEKRLHRIGGSLNLMLEGPIPSYYSVFLEPSFAWDTVNHHLLIGASVSPALALHAKQELLGSTVAPGLSPTVAVRIGWSQPWSRALRRMFVVAEPRVRLTNGQLSPGVALMIGSGSGW